MHSWILIFLMVQNSYGVEIRETEYECGAHGRFEYCIDGVAGCVIGCHCHPGYYFDTDTKICEPNSKLSHNYRRNYDLEPTRIFVPPTPPAAKEPATTVSNAIDEKIEIISKDADDLGDWLYNQFFKTIENQVINKTKDDTIVTRRSESDPTFIRKPTRRSHRYWRARRKKKKKGLKNKLLRITEDDSLFDSDSSSTSDESSASSSSSAASEEESHEKLKRKKIKEDHGHKKIVVFNKRPKPPLPSFIFLPNMETPFFPPIGLPPPPMPMYPMVPVPPMMGPFPFPAATPACDTETKKKENDGTQPPQTDKMPTLASEKPLDDKPTEKKPSDDRLADNSPPDEKPSDDNPADNNPADDMPPDDNPVDDKPPDENPTDDNPPSILRNRTKQRRGPRNKLVQRLRQKLKRKNKFQNYLANEYYGPQKANHLPKLRHRPLPEINVEEELAGLQDVDFKYLSQLIHRADLNNTNQSPPTTTSATQMKNMLTISPPSRRNYYDNYPDQITKVLSDLINQPMDQTRDDQLTDDSPNEVYRLPNPIQYNVPNQPTHNAPNQLPYNVPNQSSYKVSDQISYNLPNQPSYNVPNQPSYNALNQPTNNVLNQSTYNVPNQPTYNVPNHSSYNAPNQATQNVFNQPKYNVPNQPAYNVLSQPKYNVANQPAYDVANQPTHVSLSQPLKKNPYRKRIEDPNEIYFAKLGRQIASMIRNVDGDKDVDIEIKSSSNIPNNPVLAGPSGSLSYWERSVRSPYKRIMNSNNKKEINNLKFSNENLFSLENKVVIAASTKPTLTLHELENIISKMHKAKSKFIQRNKSSNNATKSSKSSFNVNLLPGNDQQFHSVRKHNKRAQNIILHKRLEPNYVENSANTKILKLNLSSTKQPPQIKSSLLSDFTIQASYDILNETTPRTNTFKIKTYVPDFTAQKSGPEAVPKYIYKMPSQYFNSYAYTVLPLPQQLLLANMQPSYMQTTTSRTYYQQLNPMILNHKPVKYLHRINNNQYLYEKASVPLNPRYSSSRIKPVGSRYESYGKRFQPSYFHHAVHHFDYFDDLL